MKKILQWLLRQLKRLVIYRDKEHIGFSFAGFTLFIWGVTIIVFGSMLLIVWWQLPETFSEWKNQPLYVYAAWYVGMRILLSWFEWFYHRYVLHKVVWKVFESQQREHGHHHNITNVTATKNDYEIKDPHQTESATFPWYAVFAFWGVFSVVILPLQFLFPAHPVWMCYVAITGALTLYETFHAALHMDYNQHWRKRVEKYRWVYRMYAFHYVHHVNDRVNQAIGGLFGWAVWDRVFGTYYIPDRPISLPDEPLKGKLTYPEAVWLVRKADILANAFQKRNKRDAKEKALDEHRKKLVT